MPFGFDVIIVEWGFDATLLALDQDANGKSFVVLERVPRG